MRHWQTIQDLDEEIIYNVITQYFLDESCSDIDLSTRDREMLPYLAKKDLEHGGEPLIEIRVNQKKLQKLQDSVREKQEIADTVGKLEETHSDREERIYDFSVTDQTAMYHLLVNANAVRQMNGLPDIAPAELFNTLTTFQYGVQEPMNHLAIVTIDLDVMKRAIKFARKSELEVDKYNPYIRLGSDVL